MMALLLVISRKSVLILYLVGILFAAPACSSYVSPKKVDRIISVDSWTITNFYFNGEQISGQFTGKALGFGESGSVSFLPSVGESGSWNTSLNRKPTLLYIQGFTSEPYFYLNDDWTVVSCDKRTIKLESTVGSITNTITLVKKTE